MNPTVKIEITGSDTFEATAVASLVNSALVAAGLNKITYTAPLGDGPLVQSTRLKKLLEISPAVTITSKVGLVDEVRAVVANVEAKVATETLAAVAAINAKVEAAKAEVKTVEAAVVAETKKVEAAVEAPVKAVVKAVEAVEPKPAAPEKS